MNKKFFGQTKSAQEKFANLVHMRVAQLESGVDKTDFQERTARVCTVYTREDVALLSFQLDNACGILSQIRYLLSVIVIILSISIFVSLW